MCGLQQRQHVCQQVQAKASDPAMGVDHQRQRAASSVPAMRPPPALQLLHAAHVLLRVRLRRHVPLAEGQLGGLLVLVRRAQHRLLHQRDGHQALQGWARRQAVRGVIWCGGAWQH